MKGFLTFIREQGIIGLAMGFVLGGSVSKLVTSFVNDIINPIIGIGLNSAGNYKEIYQYANKISCQDHDRKFY